jgi:hypothetical protein
MALESVLFKTSFPQARLELRSLLSSLARTLVFPVSGLFLIHAPGSSAGLAEASLARAGRAARAGTRAARVVRIFKLISIFVQKKREREAKKKQKEDFMERETKIGTLIADGISRKVILIVAAMIIGTMLINLIEDQDIFSGPVAEREFTSNLNNL